MQINASVSDNLVISFGSRVIIKLQLH